MGSVSQWVRASFLPREPTTKTVVIAWVEVRTESILARIIAADGGSDMRPLGPAVRGRLLERLAGSSVTTAVSGLAVGDLRGMEALVAGHAAGVLGMEVAAVDPKLPLQTFGLDSLMAMELRNGLSGALGMPLPGTLLFDYPTVVGLAEFLWGRCTAAGRVAGGERRALATGVGAGRREAAGVEVAVSGVACRYPGGETAEAFWAVVEGGRVVEWEVPASRRGNGTFYDDQPGVLRAALLEDVDLFDPLFFHISPAEAEGMDPQQRLLLELAWLALEDGGIVPGAWMGGQVGVYVGVCSSDYAFLAVEGGAAGLPTGVALSVASGRLSYFFGLRGPCASVDTACSSSLVAAHLAVRALRQGDGEAALVGGANGIFAAFATSSLQRLNALSPTGRCATFDASADGYLRAEGAAAMVLERRPTHPGGVRAVVCGSAVNQDGRSNGLTAPTGPAQEALMRAALADAGLAARRVGYLECHGTGTRLGDPIEVEALGQVYGEGREAGRALVLGALKANVGHSEGAAGIAGLVKAVLCVEHGVLPAVARFRELNPAIRPLEGIPAVIPTERRLWGEELAGGRRVAAVSAFAFSGTNAHAIVGAGGGRGVAPTAAGKEDTHTLCLSAATPASLEGLATRYAAFVEAGEGDLGALCRSARTTRTALRHRLVVVGRDRGEMAARLRRFRCGGEGIGGGGVDDGLVKGDAGARGRRRVAFLFPGLPVRAGAGRGLMGWNAAFTRGLEECDRLLRGALGGQSIVEVLHGDESAAARERLREPRPGRCLGDPLGSVDGFEWEARE